MEEEDICECGHEADFHNRFRGRCYFLRDEDGVPVGCQCPKFWYPKWGTDCNGLGL